MNIPDDSKLRDRKGKVLYEMQEVIDKMAEPLHIYRDGPDRRAMEVAVRSLALEMNGGGLAI